MPYLVLGLTQGLGTNPVTNLLLVHSDTTNGSTTFTDSSASGLTISTTGTVVHSTEQSKFGTSSLKFTAGALLVSDASLAVGFGAFTIDFWLYRTGSLGTAGLFSGGLIGGAYGPQAHTSGTDLVQSWNVWSSASNGGGILNTTIPANTWTHYAFIRRDDGFINVAVDGVFGPQWVGHSTRDAASTQFAIGARYGTGNFPASNIYIDEFRYASGAAWTENFTPPAAPY